MSAAPLPTDRADLKFDVHLWYRIRVTVPGVEAASYKEAAGLAEASLDLQELDRLLDQHAYVESDLHPGKVLDVCGDFDNGPIEALADLLEVDGVTRAPDLYSQDLESRCTPYAQLCKKLADWHTEGRSLTRLQEILEEAQETAQKLFLED
jgi:hypothetical protein